MFGVEYLAGLMGGLAGLGMIETWLHKRRVNSIPIRIHVSGTRGKSSVTRLLAAGMNASGIPTIAKTTGTLARMVLPDGAEVPVYRPAGANIIEQKRIIAVAKSLQANALVLECMALQPLLHWILENKIVHATHAVITNARADHLDIMGPTETDVAKTLAGMIPSGGVIYTSENKHREVFHNAATDRGARFVATSHDDILQVSDNEMAGFSYVEHKENVALALKVLSDFGIDREKAIRGMWKAVPDPGALSELTLDFFGRRIVLVNGFAANDPQSTEMIWRHSVKKFGNYQRKIGIFNLRDDRPSRTLQLARDATFWHQADRILLIGSGAHLFARIASKHGLDPGQLILADRPRIEDIFETIVDACGKSALIVGMGNIGGQGLELVRYFRNRSVLESN